MPSGDLIKTLRDAGAGFFVLAAISSGCVAVAWRLVGAPSEDVQGYVEAGAIASTVIAFALLFWRATAKNRLLGRFLTRVRLRSRFDQLTPQQRQLIVDVYRSGQRKFDAPSALCRQRYFEELVEWGFLEPIDVLVWVSGQSTWPYQLSTASWDVIKNKTP